ncbi:MAG: SRPBCC family protein [Chitinophagales bacterium]|nr:SRPBCC family protein [Bacteroidota bacterium]MCB9043213.1 SRPBCC family protein [Chitinophagales bacterium]
MKLLKYLGILFLMLILLVLILNFIAPSESRVERTQIIKAPNEVVHNNVKTLKAQNAWSPWVQRDPTIKHTYTGNDGEVGSSYTWEGDPKTSGKGSMTLKSSTPERTEVELHFIEPFEANPQAYIIQKPQDDKTTEVTWGFYQKNSFPSNIFMMFMNMDKAIGGDYEMGLANLKKLCEKQAEVPNFRGYNIKKIDLPQRAYATIRSKEKMDKIGAFFQKNMPILAAEVQKQNAMGKGFPSGIYYSWDEAKGETDMAVAMPASKEVQGKNITMANFPPQKVYMTEHVGAYEKSAEAYYAMDDFFKANKLSQVGPVVEDYVVSFPEEQDTTKWVTRIYFTAEPEK